MARPTFDGLDMFGSGVSAPVRPNPNGRITRGYPGIHGLQTVNLGGRGGVAEVTGMLGGATPTALAISEAAFFAYQVDGGAYTFIDSLGRVWASSVMAEFDPQGPVLPWDPVLGYSRAYRATILILR